MYLCSEAVEYKLIKIGSSCSGILLTMRVFSAKPCGLSFKGSSIVNLNACIILTGKLSWLRFQINKKESWVPEGLVNGVNVDFWTVLLEQKTSTLRRGQAVQLQNEFLGEKCFISKTVWPDLAKFLHCGKILEGFGNFETLVCICHTFKAILITFYVIGPISIGINCQKLKNYIVIWSQFTSSIKKIGTEQAATANQIVLI